MKNPPIKVEETLSLVNEVSTFIIPRLEKFLEVTEAHIKRSQEDKAKFQDFLSALKLIDRDQGSWSFTNTEKEELEKGLKAFPDIFMKMWW